MNMRKLVPVAVILLLLIGGIMLSRSAGNGDATDAHVSKMIPQIEAATGLQFITPPVMETRTSDDVRTFLTGQLEDSVTAQELAKQELVFKRLGLIDSNVSLRDVYLDVLQEQVAGYYDPKTKVLYIVDGSTEEIRNITITHELVHALQDQHLQLDSIQDIRGADDRQLAAHAVVEGQATLEQMHLMLGRELAAVVPGGWEGVRRMIRAEQSKMPRFAAAPGVVQELLLFPYLSGAEFTRRFKQERPGENILDNLPTSTEQILHTNAYFPVIDHPTTITLPALRNHASLHENTLGEFGIRLFLYEKLKNAQEALLGAMGWDGDRYTLFSAGSSTGLAWVSVWDTPVDAAEFRDMVARHFNRSYATSSSRTVPAAQLQGMLTAEEFRAGGRLVLIGGMEIGGKPAVIYVDVPDDMAWSVFDIRAISAVEQGGQ